MKEYFWSEIILGVTGLGGTFVSIVVLMRITSKEANTMEEYLDIFNDILEGVKENEQFFILSPAHNAGQKDATSNDKTIRRKYELNQELLEKKVRIAKGEYTLLEYYASELKAFGEDAPLADRMKMIENYLEQSRKDEKALEESNEYSFLFKFLMKFSKEARNEATQNDHLLTIVQSYMDVAYKNLYNLMLSGMGVNGINKESYLQAPMVLIISERMAYFGQYKLTEAKYKSGLIIRGIKVTDEHGINSLRILYDAVTEKFSKRLKPVGIPDVTKG